MKTTTIPLQAAMKIAQFLPQNTRVTMPRFVPAVAAAMVLLTGPAHAVIVADVGGDWVNANTLPAGWGYFDANAANGGIETALTPNQVVGGAGNTGFGGGNNTLNLGAVTGNGVIFSDGTANSLVAGTDLAVHPGDANQVPPYGREYVILRYTISASDILNGRSATIAGSFRVLVGGYGNSITASVFRNSTQLWTAAGNGNTLTQADGTFNLSTTVAIGDTIDFVVYNNGNFAGDETAVRGTIDLHPIDINYTFNDNAAPAGFTVEGSPSYSGGQLVLDGTQSMSIPTPLPVTDNFGIEIICTPSALDGFNFLVSNNDGANDGWGLLQVSGSYGGIAEGVTQFGSAGAATPGAPVRLALVRAGGVATVYKNGIAVGTTTTESRATPTTFTIGANQNAATPTYEGRFKGSIDQVRLFTFAPGTFNPATDLLIGPTGISFSTWVDGTYVPALTLKGPGDDQDGDCLVNLQEFAFGTGPTVADGQIAYVSGGGVTPGVPKIFPNVPASGMYSMVFGRRVDYLAAGLAYKVQFSAGLEAWVDNNDTTNPPVKVATNGMVDAIQVKYPDSIVTPSGSRTPKFSRVMVSMP